MIHLLWCTIRPEAFKNMHSEWMSRALNKENIKTYVAVNWDNDYNIINNYLTNRDVILKVDTNKIGVCYPSYKLSSYLNGNNVNYNDDDIIVFASDDFLPPNNWDNYLINKLNNKGDVGLMVRDGYQLPNSSNMQFPAITIPIMTYGCLKRLNMIIYNPVYTHMYSDCELYNNLKDLNMLYDDRLNDDTTFEHLHYAAGKRSADQFDVSYNNKWVEDETTWKSRIGMSVEERIKVI